MLHYVHQLVANFVCLLFGAGQVAYNEFIRAFSLKTAAPENNISENVKLQARKLKQQAERH